MLSSCNKRLCLSAGKNSTSFPMVFIEILQKDLNLFWVVCACLVTLNDSITKSCRRFDVYLHAKNIFHNSLLSYDITFWRILQFDWPVDFLPITRDPKFCWQICYWNINNNISFYFRLFPIKTNMKKNFEKFPKTLFWAYSGPFFPKFGQKWIFLEKGFSIF